MELNWTDPAVQAAIISAVGSVVAAAIAALCAAIIGKQITGRKRLQEKLDQAQGDILFLLAVEEEHCKLHQVDTEISNKRRVRRVAGERGFRWSGRFTPSRIKARLGVASSSAGETS